MTPFNNAMNVIPDTLRGLEHFVVVQRLRQHARGEIRDARNAQHLDAHVPRHDRFGHRRHADRIGADQCADTAPRPGSRTTDRDRQHTRRAAASRPCAAAASSARRRSRGEYTCVRSGNRTPNRSSFGPDQRTAAQQVDMVVDHHQIARGEPGIDAAGRVRQDERLHAEHAEHPRGKRHRSQVVPLVEMGAARQRRDRAAPRSRR